MTSYWLREEGDGPLTQEKFSRQPVAVQSPSIKISLDLIKCFIEFVHFLFKIKIAIEPKIKIGKYREIETDFLKCESLVD